jgi:hypothetical protein
MEQEDNKYTLVTLQEQIPVFNNTKKKLRVAMLQLEDRDDPFFNWCMNINKEYCKNHDIDYIFFKSGPDTMPAYWAKVQVVLDIMNLGKHDLVIWMDSDAFVYKNKVDVRNFFSSDSKHSMVIAGDPPQWGNPVFMAAVWAVKNDSIGRKIMNEWMTHYKSEYWEKLTNGKWRSKRGAWAGINYEQGSFAQAILPKYTKAIKSLNWYILHETNCKNPHADCWSIHLPGAIRQVRQPCVVFEQTRKRINKFSFTLYIIILLVLILLLIIGLYIWVYKNSH